LGEVRGSRTPVVLASDQVYEPDILFVARERAGLITERGVMGAPDLVVEILSRATVACDRGPKLRGYERAGVREVWLIDPYGPAGTEFYRLEGGRFVAVQVEGEVLGSVAIPGFALRVEWLWPERRFIPVREALAWVEAQKEQPAG
jgi:Uma2 family endonuclease